MLNSVIPKTWTFSDEHNTNIIADFLCHISDKSYRPESVVKMCSAALTFMFEALGKCSLVHNPDIKRLITGIINSGILIPMKRSQPMPTNSFVELFHSWGKNDELTIKQLRMKTVTLLALVCMTRPSDLAPKGVNLNSRDLLVHNIVLSLNNIQFMADNFLTIFFFGIKNDTSRSGFEVNIPPNEDDIVMDLCRVYALTSIELMRLDIWIQNHCYYTPNRYIVPAKFGVHFLPLAKNVPKRTKMHLNEIGLTNTEFCKIQSQMRQPPIS